MSSPRIRGPDGVERALRVALEPVQNERGAILVLVAVSLVVILGMVGLALDSSRLFVARAEVSAVVDASALAAAKTMRAGHKAAKDFGLAVAAANGHSVGGGKSLHLQFGTTADGELTVTATAAKPVKMTFMRLFGFQQVRVSAVAVAAVPPVDLVLVLDQSGSLGNQACGASAFLSAWQCLQDASKRFVDLFDPNFDQMGLVTFQLRGTERFSLAPRFPIPVKSAIDNALSAGDTNPGEGLRLALLQFQGPAVRSKAAKAVVFFTDGRPTAFRDIINGQDRAIAVLPGLAGGTMRGYFDNPDALPTDQLAGADGCRGAITCWGWTEPTIRTNATDMGTQAADAIRAEGVYIYAIGLGNPNAAPILAPDMAWLALLANENGVANPNQPQGRAFFAQSGTDLRSVFDLVAQDLQIRLAQ